MKRRRTWKIIAWPDRPIQTTDYELACSRCGVEAFVPLGSPGCLIIAAVGLRLFFDPPGHVPPNNFMPQAISCRACNALFEHAPMEAS